MTSPTSRAVRPGRGGGERTPGHGRPGRFPPARGGHQTAAGSWSRRQMDTAGVQPGRPDREAGRPGNPPTPNPQEMSCRT